MLATLAGDIRYALRGMMTKRAFSAVVLATLALGIGANVAIFSVVNGVLLRPLPYPDADRVVQVTIGRRTPRCRSRSSSITGTAQSASSDLPHSRRRRRRSPADRDPERVTVTRVSDGFFSILRVPAAIGRTFVPEEDRRHGHATSRGRAEPRTLDAAVRRRHVTRRQGDSHQQHQRDGRRGDAANGSTSRHPRRRMWTPLRLNYDTLWTRNNHYLQMIARLTPGATAEQPPPSSTPSRSSSCATIRTMYWAERTARRHGDAASRPAPRQDAPVSSRAARRRGLRTAHRVRERREPAAGARRGAAQGAGDPHGVRRVARPAGATGADGERAVRGRRRRARRRAGVVGSSSCSCARRRRPSRGSTEVSINGGVLAFALA